ncbi:hypothetical protein ACFL5Z_05255 [Planctomycetota bacterium]
MKPETGLNILQVVKVITPKAELLLLEAPQARRLMLGDTHPNTMESWNNLINLYRAWNKPEKAKEWRAKLAQTEAVEQ